MSKNLEALTHTNNLNETIRSAVSVMTTGTGKPDMVTGIDVAEHLVETSKLPLKPQEIKEFQSLVCQRLSSMLSVSNMLVRSEARIYPNLHGARKAYAYKILHDKEGNLGVAKTPATRAEKSMQKISAKARTYAANEEQGIDSKISMSLKSLVEENKMLISTMALKELITELTDELYERQNRLIMELHTLQKDNTALTEGVRSLAHTLDAVTA